jgi:hypothetical protein
MRSLQRVGDALGMGEDLNSGESRLPFDLTLLHNGQVVADLIYDPMSTPLMQAASAVGARAVWAANNHVNSIPRIIDRGLVDDGRLARLVVKVPDRPGSLARLTELVARAGANVLEVGHQRAFADISVGDVEIVIHVETRGRDHVGEILKAIRDSGTPVEEAVRPTRAVGRPSRPDTTS